MFIKIKTKIETTSNKLSYKFGNEKSHLSLVEIFLGVDVGSFQNLTSTYKNPTRWTTRMRLLRCFEKAKKGFPCWWEDFEWQLQLISKYVCSLHRFLISSLFIKCCFASSLLKCICHSPEYQYNQCWKMLASQEQPLQAYHGQMIFYGKKR